MTTLHTLDIQNYQTVWHGASWREIAPDAPPPTVPSRRAGQWTARKGDYLARVRHVVGAEWRTTAQITSVAQGRKDSIAQAVYRLVESGEVERRPVTSHGRERYVYRMAVPPR